MGCQISEFCEVNLKIGKKGLRTNPPIYPDQKIYEIVNRFVGHGWDAKSLNPVKPTPMAMAESHFFARLVFWFSLCSRLARQAKG